MNWGETAETEAELLFTAEENSCAVNGYTKVWHWFLGFNLFEWKSFYLNFLFWRILTFCPLRLYNCVISLFVCYIISFICVLFIYFFSCFLRASFLFKSMTVNLVKNIKIFMNQLCIQDLVFIWEFLENCSRKYFGEIKCIFDFDFDLPNCVRNGWIKLLQISKFYAMGWI